MNTNIVYCHTLPTSPSCPVCYTGDAQTGWDTDQFLSDPREATLLMGVLIKNGGLGTGGINFDAKIRWACTTAGPIHNNNSCY